MEGANMVWTIEQQRQMKALQFSYDKDNDKWVKNEKDCDEIVWATASYLYWFNTENGNGGNIMGNNRFPIMDFDALIIFLRALKSIKELMGD